METFLNYIKDIMIRLKARSPKFFIALQIICVTLFAFIQLTTYMNTKYLFGLESIHIIGAMNLMSLLREVSSVLLGVAGGSQLTVSDKSKYKKTIKIK